MRIKIFLFFLTLLFSAQQITAQVTASDTSGCAPLVGVIFTGPAGASNINWDFDDGASSNLPSPSHTFGSAGTYTVVYTAIVSGNNYIDSIHIYVYGKPSAYFKGSLPLNGCIPLPVSFHDSSFGGGGSAITKWEWAFGDGGVDVSNNPNPNYIYTVSGIFPVSLKVTDANGCDSSYVRNSYIITSDLPDPVITNIPDPLFTCLPPFSVTFTGDNSSSGSPLGNTLTYSWSFGNGDTSSLQNPAAVNYLSQGSFNVVLIVTDNNNCSDSIKKNVRISNPVASFYAVGAINDTVCTKVTFSNHSTPGTSFFYEYGDALTGTDSIHIYPGTGVYHPVLHVQLGSCIDDSIITIVVEESKADFTSSPIYSCSYPLTVQFTNNSINAVKYSWSFGGGGSSTLPNPIHTFNLTDTNQYTIFQPDNYTTTLLATSPHGCNSFFQSTTIINKPTALFNVNKAYGCAPLTVTFKDTSLSGESITTRFWIFDDGSTHGGNDSVLSHTFNLPGIYFTKLIITNSAGCIDTSYAIIIYVGVAPTPSFSISPTPVCVHTPVQFNNLTPPGDSAHWFHYIADGGTMSHCFNDPNPVWYFNTNTGLQNITLQASYNGCVGSSTVTNMIDVKGPLVHFYPVNDCNNHFTYSFNGTIKDAANWTWDFGDATILNTTTDSTPTHIYAATGDYTIKLIGYNPATGCVPDTETVMIYVRDPKAAFIADTLVCTSESVLFNATPSQDVAAICHEGFLYYWNDNTHPDNSDTMFTSHIFSSSGIYPVTLIVKDKNGCRDTVQKNIHVHAVHAAYHIDHTYGCLPLTIQFTDSSKADTTIVNWQWYFGDGSSSTAQNPVHQYIQPPPGGSYLVTFIATDTLGCSDIKYFIIVPSIPDSLFAATTLTNICTGDSVHFTPHDINLTYLYHFGDGDSSAMATPWHSYQNSGPYNVSLTVTDSIGCKATKTIVAFVNVQDYPQAGFFSTADTTFKKCYPLLVNYTDTSKVNIFGTRTWDLGNGSVVIGSPSVGTIYQAPGNYLVTLIVQTTFGCRDTVSKYLPVTGPVGNFNIVPSTICKGQSVTLSIKDTIDVLGYFWDFGDGTDTIGISPVSHTFNINPASGQTMIGLVMWSPDSACTATKSNPLFIQPVIADFSINNNDTVSCVGELNSINNLSLNATTFNWLYGDGSSFAGSTPPPHAYSPSGIYTVTLSVTNGITGCKDSVAKLISIYNSPTIVASGGDACLGDSVQLSASGGSSYLWSPPTGLNTTNISNPYASPLSSTNYTVTAVDLHGCSASETVAVVIYQPPPQFTFDTTIVIGEQIPIGYQMPDPGYTYQWTPTTWLSCICPTPVAQPLEDILYSLTISDSIGCFSATSTYKFKIKPVTSIDVPSAFTPNNDHHNDIIYVNGWGIKSLLEFKIFNRWGTLIFETTDINQGWDGLYKGEPQPQDTYVYQAKVETWINGKSLSKKGTFELIR